MAQLISVKLSRFDGSPWGFRLQGGKDFGTPLIIQKVHSGSPAEVAGLRTGDALVRVNNVDIYDLKHKEAQDVLVRAGNNFEISIQRGGGSIWKPSVSPVNAPIPPPAPTMPASHIIPVTKTSLAAKQHDAPLIGSGHNFSPKPFMNGTNDGHIKSIVNKQYNSPVGIYSEETIAETLSAQAEVLAGGVLGVNFKKNEKGYNAENSEVFKMVQEADKEPKTPEPAEPSALSSVIMPPAPVFAGSRPVAAPETKSQQHQQYQSNHQPQYQPEDHQQQPHQQQQQPYQQPDSPPQSSLPPGQNICAECERLIVGVFVRIKEKNLHVECFKCSTCGTSLKNVGYYNINNKLYCDIHAKLVARQNAPTGMIPITVPPGGKIPTNTISAALAHAPLTPPLSNHGSPQPFSACNRSSPDYGSYHPRLPSLNTNGFIKNGDCEKVDGETKTYTSTLTIQTGGTEVSSNNCIGPKPFGSTNALSPTPNFSSPPLLNSGSNTLPRPQHQTVTANEESIKFPSDDDLIKLTCCEHTDASRGPFITALGKIWCPDHFVCVNAQCRRALQDIGFVEEKGQLYCEYCYERFLAPSCSKCSVKVKGDCLTAIGKHFHPECFTCVHCGKLFGNNQFFLEDGLPYCENDWNELFTTKCFACGFPVEAGDRWVEALNNNYHSQCFNCSMCKKNLEGQSFYAKGGRPFCKNHAR